SLIGTLTLELAVDLRGQADMNLFLMIIIHCLSYSPNHR
ncbi:MAG: hypothetical protein H6Q39_701, partial [Chloroflexi bacterium]|nr:hypothetical protein [Chloroflexota bacterium]